MLPLHSIALIVVTTACWGMYFLPSLRSAAGQIWDKLGEDAFGNVCGLIGAVLLTPLIGLNLTLAFLVVGYLLTIGELVTGGIAFVRKWTYHWYAKARRVGQ